MTKEESTLSVGEKTVLTGIGLLCIGACYTVAKNLGLGAWTMDTTSALGFSSLILVGLAASFSSCLTLVGGLLLSISASWSMDHQTMKPLRRIRPMISFNAGRVIGFFILGGLTGLLGSALSISIQVTGILQIILSLFMLWLGMKIVGILPKKYCTFPLPHFFQEKLRTSTHLDHPLYPGILGAFTYFVPCGFTQSVQLLALASGNFTKGGIIMLAFALGTLPSLVGISAVSAYASGKTGKIFFSIAGTISIFFGILTIQNGIALTGIQLPSLVPCCKASDTINDAFVSIDENGQQIISVDVHSNGFSPSQFVMKAQTPTWIYARAENQLSGCLSQIVIPSLNVSKSIEMGDNWIGPFTATDDFEFMCSMGMYRAHVKVTPTT